MKKIEVLIWGIKHIAGNHHFSGNCYTDFRTGETVAYTGRNVPTCNDVRMLAEDLGVSGCCKSEGFTMRIIVSKEWAETVGQEEFVPAMGQMMWKRTNKQLGGHLGYMCEEYDPFVERTGSLFLHVDELKGAVETCINACKRTRNGNEYSVWEVGMNENTMVYCCQWSAKDGELKDTTEQVLKHYEEQRQEREEIIASIKNE